MGEIHLSVLDHDKSQREPEELGWARIKLPDTIWTNEWVRVNSPVWKRRVQVHKKRKKERKAWIMGGRACVEEEDEEDEVMGVEDDEDEGTVRLQHEKHTEDSSNQRFSRSNDAGHLVVVIRCIRNIPSGIAEPPMVKYRLTMTSLGISLVDASKRTEIAYFIFQRMRLKVLQQVQSVDLYTSIGNIQLDNHIQNTKFKVVLAPEPSSTRNVWDTRMLLRYGNPSTTHIEFLSINIRRMNLALDEAFLIALMGINDTGLLDALLGKWAWGSGGVVDHPTVAVPDLETLRSTQMLMLDFLDLRALALHIELDLEGGKGIRDNSDRISMAVRHYIPSVVVADLLLRFRGTSRTGIFTSMDEFTRKVLRHYVYEGVKNSHRVLANLGILGNPAQTGKRFYHGLREMIYQPYLGFRQGTFSSTISGVQGGFMALVANLASGTSELVHGLSDIIVTAVAHMHVHPTYDVLARPLQMTFHVIREISGAVAEGM